MAIPAMSISDSDLMAISDRHRVGTLIGFIPES